VLRAPLGESGASFRELLGVEQAKGGGQFRDIGERGSLFGAIGPRICERSR